jgi:hypothetical protein
VRALTLSFLLLTNLTIDIMPLAAQVSWPSLAISKICEQTALTHFSSQAGFHLCLLLYAAVTDNSIWQYTG